MDSELEVGQETLPEPSLRDELASNLADALKESPPAEGTVETPPPETAEQKADRVRDEKGQFAAKPPEPAPVEPAAPKRPSSWKKEHWADYDKIVAENPKLAAYLNEREGQFASGVSTYKQEWEQAKPLIDAIAPFQPILQQNGIDPAQWISNLGNAHHQLVMGSPQDKVAMFQRLAAEYRVPVQLAVQGQDGQWQLLGQQAPMQPQAPAFDPRQVQTLVQQELQAQSTKQTLEAFTREAPEKYPHFESVKQTMAGLLQAGLADDLPSAYEAALRHPRHADIFAGLQQQQTAQQEAERRAASQQKVQRARANAVSTGTATPSGVMANVGEKGLRDEIAANLRAVAGGRV